MLLGLLSWLPCHVWSIKENLTLKRSDAYIRQVNYTIIGSDNGLSAVWHKAIIWTNAASLSIGPLVTNSSEIWIPKFSFKKMHLNMSSAKCQQFCSSLNMLTHWGRATHICVSKLTIIGSDNGLSPDRRQAIIWTNAGLLFIGPLGNRNSNIFIQENAFESVVCKTAAILSRPQCVKMVKQHLMWHKGPFC